MNKRRQQIQPHMHGSSQKNVTQRAVKIWGLYAILVGEGEEGESTYWEDKWLWKDERAPGRTGGSRPTFVTAPVEVWHRDLASSVTRVSRGSILCWVPAYAWMKPGFRQWKECLPPSPTDPKCVLGTCSSKMLPRGVCLPGIVLNPDCTLASPERF